jgi:hypothetical protein
VDDNAKGTIATNLPNKPMPFPARIPILPKGALFSPAGRSSFFDKEAMEQGMKKLANLNLSVTSHGRKKKGLNKFLTTTKKFNKLADGGDSVCLDDLPFSKESSEITRPGAAKSSHVPLDKMFTESNKDNDDTLNDSGGLSFSMDLAVSETKPHNKLFSLSSQPSRRGLFAKKPKKFQTFDDSGAISFSMDDTNLPKQTWHEVKKGTSLDQPQKDFFRDDNPLGNSVFGAGFDLDAHLTSSSTDSPSQNKAVALESRKLHTKRDNADATSSDDFAWELPRVADEVLLKSDDLPVPSMRESGKECGEDRGLKLEDLLEKPGYRKISHLAEPSICGTLADRGTPRANAATSFPAIGALGHSDQGKAELMCEGDENSSTASDKDTANPLPDAHRGIQLNDVLNDTTLNPAPSDASVCDQSVMTLEQQQHFLQLNLPGMVGYKSSSSLSVLEHAVEVLGDSAGGRGSS